MGDLDTTFGMTYIGVVVAAFLYGILSLQTYIYWMRFVNDAKFDRIFVLVLWGVDTLQLVCICHMQYHYMISNYMNPAALAFSNWSFNLEVGLTTIITFMVQAFFARRAWFFTKQVGARFVPTRKTQLLGAIIGLVSLTQLGFGLATFAYAWILGEFVKYLDYRWLVACWLGSAAVCDVLIVYMLSTALMTQRTGFGRTDALVNKLLRYAINTGLLTSIFAILDLVTFCTMPNFVHLAFNFVLGKLYTNTLLATLNAREIAQKPNIIHIEDGSYRLGEFESSRTTGTIKFNHPVDTCASQDPGKEIGMTTHPTIRISEDDRGPSSELHGNA